jgi:hypothetical protein
MPRSARGNPADQREPTSSEIEVTRPGTGEERRPLGPGKSQWLDFRALGIADQEMLAVRRDFDAGVTPAPFCSSPPQVFRWHDHLQHLR